MITFPVLNGRVMSILPATTAGRHRTPMVSPEGRPFQNPLQKDLAYRCAVQLN